MDDLLSRLKAALADRYVVESEVGRGGMATVYRARDLRHDRSVAIKVLDPALSERVGRDAFLNEMQVTARLQHPLILPLHDSGSADGLLYYVMPFVEGETLRDRLRREGQLPLADAIRITRDAADALAYAHEKGIVHRDIKPENILLTGGHAVVADFGIARAMQIATDRTLLQNEAVSGTPAYMSPEQATGEPGDARSDIYSLGCVLYEMLAGNPPFTAPTVATLLKRVLVEPPVPIRNLRASVPESIAEALARSLEKLPADRWNTALEFGAALAGPHDTAPTMVVPETGKAEAPAGRLIGVAAGFLIAAAVLLALTRFLVQKLGLPDWVFSGALVLLAVGLPILLATVFMESRGRSSGSRRRWTWRNAMAGGGLAFLALALLVSGYMLSRKTGIGPGASLVSAGVLDARDRILIADFENATPDSLLGTTLKEALSVDLSQSPSVTVVPSSQIATALMRMQKDPKTRLSADLARELAVREGMKAVLTGELRSLGRGYVITARMLSVPNGDVILAEREDADGPEALIKAVDRLSKKLRERIGESLKSIRANKPLEQVTTPSLSALQKYSQAVVATDMEGNDEKAIALLDEAVSQDSTFAMAYRKLATILDNSGRDPAQVYKAVMKVFRLRERLPDRERYLAEGSYYRFINDYDQAALAYQKMLDLNPEDWWALNNCGVVADQLGQPERALDFFRRAYTVSPSPLTLGNIINSEVRLGQFGDAEKSLDEFATKFPDNPGVLQRRFLIASAKGEYDLAENTLRQRIEMSKGSPFLEGRAISALGMVLALQGKLQEAERLWMRAAGLLDEAGMTSAYFETMSNLALENLLIREDPRRAREQVEKMLPRFLSPEIAPGERPYLDLVGFYSMVGEPERAHALLGEYKASVDPLIQRSREIDMPQTLAVMALGERRPQEAIQQFSLHRERRGDDPLVDLPLIGRAYETVGLPDSAIAVYERYLTLQDITRFRKDVWFLAGILVRLGDLYQDRGDRNRAIQYYSRFLDLWKNADPELQPRVRAVQMKLQALAGQAKS